MRSGTDGRRLHLEEPRGHQAISMPPNSKVGWWVTDGPGSLSGTAERQTTRGPGALAAVGCGKEQKAPKVEDEANQPMAPMSAGRDQGWALVLALKGGIPRQMMLRPISIVNQNGHAANASVQVPPAIHALSCCGRRPRLAPSPPLAARCPLGLPVWPHIDPSPLLDLDWHVPFCFIRHLQPDPRAVAACDSFPPFFFSLLKAFLRARPAKRPKLRPRYHRPESPARPQPSLPVALAGPGERESNIL